MTMITQCDIKMSNT